MHYTLVWRPVFPRTALPARLHPRFVLDILRQEIRDRQRRRGAAFLQARRETRQAYVDLYLQQRAAGKSKMPKHALAALRAIALPLAALQAAAAEPATTLEVYFAENRLR